MSAKRRQSSSSASVAAKKQSTVTLASYLDGCDEKPDIFFVAGATGQLQVTFPAHTVKLESLPNGCILRVCGGVPSGEPVSLPHGVNADGFCNLLCVLYGKVMALSQDNWHSTFATYARLLMMETELEAQLLDFAKQHMSPAMALTCLGTSILYDLYKSPFEEICWECIDGNGDGTFKSPNFLDIEWRLLLRILERDSLRVSSEIAVYKAAVSWATESLERKSKQITHAAIRKELGDALLQIRFSQMPLEDFTAGPGTTKILTDKESLDIYRSRFNKDVTPNGFNLFKRVETKKPDPTVVEGCTLCGHSDDAFSRCCEGYLRVPKKALSAAYCQNDDCAGVAYRCSCGALNYEHYFTRAAKCEECGLGMHYCSSELRPLSKFVRGQKCRWCEEIPVSCDHCDDE